MNKKLLLIVTLILLSATVFAGNQGSAGSKGSFKAGVALGYPSGVTAGWRATDKFEINALLGTNYSGFTIGVTPLFTIVDINIADQPLPLSIGPQVNFHIGALNYLVIDILADIRLEYTLKDLPLNLFAEIGMGVSIQSFPSVTVWGFTTDSYTFTSFGFSGTLGARYVF